MNRFFVALFLLCATTSPAAADELAFEFGQWQGHRMDQDGAFSHCAALSFPREDESLILAIGRDGQRAGAARSSEWKFKEGAVLMATVTIDGDLIASQIQATASHEVRFVYADADEANEAYKAIAAGRLMSFRTPSGTASFSLSGAPQVLDALIGCVGQALAEEGGTSKPALSAGQAVRLDPTEAMVQVVNMLAAAGMSGQVYLSPSEYKDMLPDFDVAWRNPDGTLGAAALYSNARRDDLDVASTNILTGDAARCRSGSFVSGVRKSGETARSFSKELFTACEDGEDSIDAYYVMSVTRDGLFFATVTIAFASGQQEVVEEKGAALARGIEQSF